MKRIRNLAKRGVTSPSALPTPPTQRETRERGNHEIDPSLQYLHCHGPLNTCSHSASPDDAPLKALQALLCNMVRFTPTFIPLSCATHIPRSREWLRTRTQRASAVCLSRTAAESPDKIPGQEDPILVPHMPRLACYHPPEHPPPPHVPMALKSLWAHSSPHSLSLQGERCPSWHLHWVPHPLCLQPYPETPALAPLPAPPKFMMDGSLMNQGHFRHVLP